ncbi:50S ribosomal protein-like protein L4 [Boeremia exigua]|uniref:50S ribosomal protein-like protein L4 n=1 Tax=Boeremia exigua TaxID=749465 RepID=UPI001E8D14E4|nr:50S ribosomal protein-like protein L4 [Boeremia exigua]KAH6625233.1 50S ribosomal protein-like protein L4 [Boeremia exigua]
MATSRISAPLRGVSQQLGRLSTRPTALPARCPKSIASSFARPIATSTPARAAAAPITTSADAFVPVTPFAEQTVLATIHQFPSLEPLRFEQFPANHLYLPVRKDILHRAVVYEGDMTRLGTASTKNRWEVRGSARKMRPQKGSGRARIGTVQSPVIRSGGVSHGPRPRDFSTELQKKVYDLAWRTALSHRFRRGELIIVDNAMEIESPSIRLLEHVLKYQAKQRGGKGKSLLVTLEERPMLEMALEELESGDTTLLWDEVDVKNLLEGSRVLIERAALNNILLSHQEDLTHKAIQPWHKGLVQASPAEELESTIGWAEFRGLMLTDPAEMDAARANAYESVASTRYAHAESLPEGPKRAELMISAYKLLAEAKQYQFAQRTGMPFADYEHIQNRENAPSHFPRIQALDYQITTKMQLGGTAEETSRVAAEKHYVEVRELEVEKQDIIFEAALLAAQVQEHLAEANSLTGDAAAAEIALARASVQRTNVDTHELEQLSARVELAKQKRSLAHAQGNWKAQQQAQEEITLANQALETAMAEQEVLNEVEETEWAEPEPEQSSQEKR